MINNQAADPHSTFNLQVISNRPICTQGSELGPFLIVVYVNDFDGNLGSMSRKFPDDPKIVNVMNN